MKRIIIVFVSAALLMVLYTGCTKAAETEKPAKEVSLETLKQKGSYVMGYQQAYQLKMRQLDTEMDLDAFMQGVQDGFKGESKIAENEMQQIFRDFYQGIRERLEVKRKAAGEKNKAEGEAWLKENAKKEGITVTASGLQYEVLKEGTGEKPKPTDTVAVHYVGTLIDGTEFDSSYKRDQPTKFRLNRVIAAWTEGVQLMSVGSKYRFFCPSDLAYGERGSGAKIGPNAVLIFEVELLGFEPSTQPSSPIQRKPQQPTTKKEQE